LHADKEKPLDSSLNKSTVRQMNTSTLNKTHPGSIEFFDSRTSEIKHVPIKIVPPEHQHVDGEAVISVISSFADDGGVEILELDGAGIVLRRIYAAAGEPDSQKCPVL
jgi:hypothetical protein